jgi:general secretion pathway protein G
MIRPSHPDRRRPGFTLVEMLVVITILGILVALLVPVIAGAVRTANEARVTGEINVMAQALASFKNKFGDYPPSRIILKENGFYDVSSGDPLNNLSTGTGPWYGNNGSLQMNYAQPYTDIGAGMLTFSPTDQTYGQIAQRSLRYLRKFFPRAQFTTTGAIPSTAAYGKFHDFNGNGILDPNPILLQGHECLVFFLGGIPSNDVSGGAATFNGVSGFSNDPQWPFVTEYHLGAPAATNRLRPFYEFPIERLIDDDNDGIPGYIDTLASQGQGRYFAYFSSYGGGGYDPNDVNFDANRLDEQLGTFVRRSFRTTFPVPITTGGSTNLVPSDVPNPYTGSLPVPTAGSPATFINNESYQILSAGVDRLYGLGGQYLPNGTDRLPIDPVVTDRGLRVREQDNLSNFSTGRLE